MKNIEDNVDFYFNVFETDKGMRIGVDVNKINDASKKYGTKSPDVFFIYLLSELVKSYYTSVEVASGQKVNYEQFTAVLVENLIYLLSQQDNDYKEQMDTEDI